MIRYFLSRVSVEGFRGINNEGDPLVLSFKTDRVNSVFAPNGSGKSSLYEALEYAFRGSIGRLDEMQAAEDPEKYVANLFHSDGRATIFITLDPDDRSGPIEIKVERDASGTRTVSSTDVADPEELLAAMDEDFALLDYTAFNRFIERTALERGRSFSSLLGLSEYGEFLRTLKAVSNAQTFKSDFDTAQLDAESASLHTQAESALRDFAAHYRTLTTRELEDISQADSWGKDVLSSLSDVALLAPLLENCSELNDVDFASLKAAVFKAESSELRDRHATLTATRNTLSTRVSAQPPSDVSVEVERLLHAYDEALSGAAEAELQGLLSVASQYLHLHEGDPSVCPLCERGGLDGLTERVDERLGALTELRQREDALRAEVMTGKFITRLVELEELITPPLDAEPPVAGGVRASVQDEINLTSEHLEAAKSRSAILEGLLAARLKSVREELEQVELALPPSLVQLAGQVATAEAARSELARHLQAKVAAEDVDRKRNAFSEWKKFIDEAHRIFAAAEGEMSQRILAELRSEYQEIFAGVM